MSAAMINIGLMRESRFSIRNATVSAYACLTGVAAGRSSGQNAESTAKDAPVSIAVSF
jgi:hypothetical protein